LWTKCCCRISGEHADVQDNLGGCRGVCGQPYTLLSVPDVLAAWDKHVSGDFAHQHVGGPGGLPRIRAQRGQGSNVTLRRLAAFYVRPAGFLDFLSAGIHVVVIPAVDGFTAFQFFGLSESMVLKFRHRVDLPHLPHLSNFANSLWHKELAYEPRRARTFDPQIKGLSLNNICLTKSNKGTCEHKQPQGSLG